MERFNLKKLNEVEGKEKYRVEVSNKFAALEDLDTEVEINTIWETIRQTKKKKTPWPSVCKQTIPTEHRHLLPKFSANFCQETIRI
jgi:hypothetical protein